MAEMTIDKKSRLLFTDSLIIDATKDNIDKAISFVESKLENNNIDLVLISRVSVCVDEIFSNICFYAYKDSDASKRCEIIINIYFDCFTITFKDEGISFDPTKSDSPDITANIEGRKIGGLGIFVVRKMMDEVTYRRVDNKNILIIKKKI